MANWQRDNATCSSLVIVSGESDKSLLSWDTSSKLRLIDTVRKVDDALSPQILKLKTEYRHFHWSWQVEGCKRKVTC